MPLRTPHKRALVAGGTGRVGAAIVERLRADGWTRRLRRPRRRRPERHGTGCVSLATQGARRARRPRPRRPRRRRRVRAEADRGVTEEDWDAALDVTAKGTFFLAQAAAPALRESNGVLVILEDVASFQAWPSFAAHCAAKAAQAMLTRVLARALAPEVRVCGIAPGSVAVEPGQEERRAAEIAARAGRSARGRRRCGAVPRGRRTSSPARASSSTAGACSNPPAGSGP